MPASALALVILAGLIHAVWNIAAKKAGGDARFAAFTSLLGTVICGVLHVLYYVILLRGYRKADLTVVYPMARGSGPLLSSLVAILLLGERITASGLLGIAAVVAGVFLIAGGPALFRAAHDPAKKAMLRKGMAYGLATGVFIAAYTVVDGYAVKLLLMSPILLDYFANFVRLGFLAPAVLRDRTAAAGLRSGRRRAGRAGGGGRARLAGRPAGGAPPGGGGSDPGGRAGRLRAGPVPRRAGGRGLGRGARTARRHGRAGRPVRAGGRR